MSSAALKWEYPPFVVFFLMAVWLKAIVTVWCVQIVAVQYSVVNEHCVCVKSWECYFGCHRDFHWLWLSIDRCTNMDCYYFNLDSILSQGMTDIKSILQNYKKTFSAGILQICNDHIVAFHLIQNHLSALTVRCGNLAGRSHTHTHLTALFRDYPGEPVPER